MQQIKCEQGSSSRDKKILWNYFNQNSFYSDFLLENVLLFPNAEDI